MTTSDLKTPETNQHPSLDPDPLTSSDLDFGDVILRRLFPDDHTGFYVDVRGGHPRFKDDTFSLYQRGWRGINIEPNYSFHAVLVEERPWDISLRVVLSGRSGDVLTPCEVSSSRLSSCDVEQAIADPAPGKVVLQEVPLTTLSSILTEVDIDHIDILKVDVEGLMEKVLNGNDWEKFRPDVVVVEANYPESSERRPTMVHSCMDQRGYRHLYFDGLNDFYLERAFAVPDDLILPQNVIDRDAPRALAVLRGQVQALQTNLTAAEASASSLQTQIDLQRTDLTTAEEYILSLERTAEALAAENRRLGRQTTHLASENRRLRRAAEQMRAELLIFNKLLDPLHGIAERVERQRRPAPQEVDGLANLGAAKARLESVYSSCSWRLTAPLRWCDNLLRGAVRWPRKRLGGNA